MCASSIFGGGSVDVPAVEAYEPKATAKQVNTTMQDAANKERQQRLAASGVSNTKQTGALGLTTSASLQKQNLLGR